MPEIPFFDCTPSTEMAQELLEIAGDVIRGGVYVGGATVLEFESALSAYLGGGYCVGVGNGLDALTLSLMALGVGPGDEVIVPSYSFIATWIAVHRVGATAVAVDVDPSNGLVDLDQVLTKITNRTKVFLPVHLYGAPLDFSALRGALRDSEVRIVEDCAQSIGARTPSGMAGTLGDIGAFSFYPTKNLGALGDGGAIFTRDIEIANKLRSLRSYGFGESRYDFADLGVNSRLDTLQAAFLTRKLSSLDAESEHRNSQASAYIEAIGGSKLIPINSGVNYSVYHHFAALSSERAQLMEVMGRRGITTDMHYPYTIESFGKLSSVDAVRFDDSDLIGARELAAGVVTFPMGSWMSDDQTRIVAKALEDSLH
jgi:dTDP-3-amino-3,4,6-trideoxy-alpha-D-glucose transaminase|tara:strand:+ start:3489 stop:4598 length:1110 start_codon:yes stop_codon:yes gene_type:complete